MGAGRNLEAFQAFHLASGRQGGKEGASRLPACVARRQESGTQLGAGRSLHPPELSAAGGLNQLAYIIASNGRPFNWPRSFCGQAGAEVAAVFVACLNHSVAVQAIMWGKCSHDNIIKHDTTGHAVACAPAGAMPSD